MKIFKSFNLKQVEILKNGGIGIIPTDTICGIVGSALNKKTVEKIYKLRKRNLKKPMIILISSVKDLKLFGIDIDFPPKANLSQRLTSLWLARNPLAEKIKRILSKIWPNKVSIIFPCKNNKFLYLHRGANSLAFRFPKNKKLVCFLKKTGPLVAPSANWEGYNYSKTIKEAQRYFKEKVDFYIDLGVKKSLHSTLIKINNGEVRIIREGAVNLHAYT